MTTATDSSSKSTILSIRLPATLRSQLEEVAHITGRPKSSFALEALSERLAYEMWDLEQTRQAIAEADRGEFAAQSDMQAIFAKYGN